ncbi:hypothetical protein CBR_g49012 [Chara braunii]|uniref:Reverse transcriptase/retrotransposon-derived protein RNase H-like domain-containing protein n=1 Tax=Chara braunii TaxID=69332 RepID=A0A388M491_CHABU|nr:hypothetical protein CBR_g49012 [Chara braunii]|eukprot:GBG89302.1 hypothetical protein CBR_g49012 [Chara braunii]
MDPKAGESILAYEECLAAFIQEANDRAAAPAKERNRIEQEEEAKHQLEEQNRLRQEEADLQAAAGHRSRQRERLFTRETVIGDETAHWVEMASGDAASETDKGLSTVAQISHDLVATFTLQQEEILHLQQTVDQMLARLQALEKQPAAVAAAEPSNLATRVQTLEDDVNHIKRVHQDFRTSQLATNLQLETQFQAAAAVTPAVASSRRPPKLDDIPVFCDQSKTNRSPRYKANRDKCEFVRQELEYLGHLVSPEGIRPLADKIQAIHEWPESKNVTDVRSFLGLAGYYQRFIKGYSKIAVNLSKLQSEERPFDFDDDARHSFETLKAAL